MYQFRCLISRSQKEINLINQLFRKTRCLNNDVKLAYFSNFNLVLCDRHLNNERTQIKKLNYLNNCNLMKFKYDLNVIKHYSTETIAADTNKLDDEEEKRKQREKTNRKMKYTLVAMLSMFSGFTVWALINWGSPRLDQDGNVIKDQFSEMSLIKQYFLRSIDTLRNYNEIIKAPSYELLLPPPLKHPYIQPPYTLVIELNGVLLNPEWTYKTGWRFKKRPFIDYFLQQCGPPLFETVIFTEDSGFTAFPLIDNLDPNGFIMHRLFRDSTRYEQGVRIKDLNCLNRDLTKVIHVDWNRKACKLNESNCIILPKWTGDSNDKTLYDLAQFLRMIASQNIDDVREIINHYSQFDNPLEAFKDYQRQIAEQNEMQKDVATKQSSFVSLFKRK